MEDYGAGKVLGCLFGLFLAVFGLGLKILKPFLPYIIGLVLAIFVMVKFGKALAIIAIIAIVVVIILRKTVFKEDIERRKKLTELNILANDEMFELSRLRLIEFINTQFEKLNFNSYIHSKEEIISSTYVSPIPEEPNSVMFVNGDIFVRDCNGEEYVVVIFSKKEMVEEKHIEEIAVKFENENVKPVFIVFSEVKNDVLKSAKHYGTEIITEIDLMNIHKKKFEVVNRTIEENSGLQFNMWKTIDELLS